MKHRVRDAACIVLGSGTSAGIPAIACECAVCRSHDPRDKRTRTSAAIRFTDDAGSDRVVLIDTSPDLRQQALREELCRCDEILYTHHHVDHLFGLDEVRRFNAVMGSPINVHAEASTLEHVQRVHPHIFKPEQNANPSFVASLIPNIVTAGMTIDLHGLQVTPLRLLHGRLPILGYRFDAPKGTAGPFPMAWCTDVSSIPPETWPLLTGLKTLVLDMLRHRHHPTHFTVDQAVEVAHEVGAESTWFVHMAHEIAHAEVDAALPEGMGLAWDGLRI